MIRVFAFSLVAGTAVFAAWTAPAVAQPAAVRTDPASRLLIEGLRDTLNNVRITDRNGRDITSAVEARVEESGISVLARHEPLIVKPRRIETIEPDPANRVVLPGGMVIGPTGGAAPGGNKAVWYRLTLLASPLPAPWEPASGEYVTKLSFGLRRPAELPAQLPTGEPVVVRIGFDGLAAEEPPPLTLTAAGLEHEQSVTLRFQVLTAAPRILVRSTLSDVDLTLRALPRLEVRPQQRAVLGFGLEAVPVTVASVFAHGDPRPMERDTLLAIEVDGRARAEPAQPQLAAGANAATFSLRSAGMGSIHVRATADGLSGAASVDQQFPFGPLLAATLGGGLGGYSRRFMKGARRRLTFRRTGEGIVVGLIAFVAGVLGVGQLQLPPTLVATEAGAFLIAALAGLVGVVILERFAGGKSAATP
jgi:hypothetical protein